MRTIFITITIFLTLQMSYHRFRSINTPHLYHAEQQLCNKNIKAFKDISLTVILGFAVNLSLFFEPVVVYNTHQLVEDYNEDNNQHPSEAKIVSRSFAKNIEGLESGVKVSQLEKSLHVSN